jgi:hypothetical protein
MKKDGQKVFHEYRLAPELLFLDASFLFFSVITILAFAGVLSDIHPVQTVRQAVVQEV